MFCCQAWLDISTCSVARRGSISTIAYLKNIQLDIWDSNQGSFLAYFLQEHSQDFEEGSFTVHITLRGFIVIRDK